MYRATKGAKVRAINRRSFDIRKKLAEHRVGATKFVRFFCVVLQVTDCIEFT